MNFEGTKDRLLGLSFQNSYLAEPAYVTLFVNKVLTNIIK